MESNGRDTEHEWLHYEFDRILAEYFDLDPAEIEYPRHENDTIQRLSELNEQRKDD